MPVDLGAETFGSFERNLAQAKRREEQERFGEAAAAYRQCAKDLEAYAEYVLAPQVRAGWLAKAQQYRDLAQQLDSRRVAVPMPEGRESDDDYAEAAQSLIYKSPVTWQDIAGLDTTKREIKAAYGLALARKPAGVELSGWRSLLFYGPPGTGKTLLAAATSNGLEATFYNVKVSDLLSKYFGESSRMMAALFGSAREQAPSVIFLDEFESLSPPRGDSQTGAEARIVSTLLAELDGLAQKGDDRYVLTIGATNLPWLIDSAVLSRFEKLVYVPLPDAAARRRILEIEIDERGLETNVPRDKLVDQTEGYSGREIVQVVREAAKQMVARANAGLIEAVDRGREAVSDYEVRTVSITESEWRSALTHIPRRTDSQDIERYEDWRNSLD
jgi:SpoVK/Ycf46/Vps4 family AAA+-type ATPase